MSQKINIGQVAELARLNLKPDEREKLSQNLEDILAYVDQLKGLNTDDIEPTSHVLSIENVFRSDVVKPSQVREVILKHAPEHEGKFFKVPKVIG